MNTKIGFIGFKYLASKYLEFDSDISFLLMYLLTCLPVEQHSAELDKDDGEEEKDEDDTDGLQVEVLDCHNDLEKR